MSVDSGAHELMIRLDNDQPGEVLTERVNGHPSDRDASDQEEETDCAYDIRRGLNTTDANDPQNHSH
jgi:hypothetical protein